MNMKNHYNLEKLNPIDKHKLIEHYKESKASISGAVFIWGDCFGKPGDTIYCLQNLTWINENELLFKFKWSNIHVYNPMGIYVNEMMIAINICDRIIWDDYFFDVKLAYDFDQPNQELKTKIIKGEHNPRINIKEPCLKLVTW